jgi:hypothetical protein
MADADPCGHTLFLPHVTAATPAVAVPDRKDR